jgi:hypothetical protein
MRFLISYGSSILLLLVSLTALLASVVDASVVPLTAWSNFKSTVVESYNGPIMLWQLLGTYNASPDFWERAAKLGNIVYQYTDDLLHDAADSYAAAADKINDFKSSMNNVVSSTGDLRREFQAKALARGIDIDEISEMLSRELAVVVEELKAEFPSPDQAQNHEERVRIISHALEKVEVSVVRVGAAFGVSEDDARARFREVEFHLQTVLVTTGDLAEQHPVLLGTLLFAGAVLILPESPILRPILSVFGFGPSGPIKGTPATWAQRFFFGGKIPKGSWFSHLQSAAMKVRLPPGTGKKIAGSIGVGLGLLGGCRGRRQLVRQREFFL